jgi:hypothetical protein
MVHGLALLPCSGESTGVAIKAKRDQKPSTSTMALTNASGAS